MRGRPGIAALAASLAAGLLATPAHAVDYAPLATPGPRLSVPKAKLRSALSCTGNLRKGGQAPVLLVPGTTVTPRENFTWNWMRDLDARGVPHCEIELPGRSMGDVQVAGEYVVYAIRVMHREGRRDIDILGHSQGGMLPRWALRFWPNVRNKVDDLVGAAASNHGTISAGPLCIPDCAPAFWQQRDNSDFIEALNSRAETFKTVDYTALYTRLDEVVIPNRNERGSTSLRDGGANVANVATQDLCPLNLAEHLALGTYDGVAYAIARDAMDHHGPADLKRVGAAACSRPLMPGVDPATFATDYAAAAAFLGTTILTARHVRREPELACYVTASCKRR